MKILVTGAAGFIGQHLIPDLQSAGHRVYGTDKADCDLRGFVPLAIADADVCIHLAARVGRALGEEDVFGTVIENAGITAALAKACQTFGTRMVYVSTSEVYGDRGDETAYEDELYSYRLREAVTDWGKTQDGALPHNLYGLTKRWGEEACRLYCPESLTILRLSMPYGPGYPPGKGRMALINFLWQAMTGQPIPVHRGAARSWVWVGDLVRGIRVAVEQGEGVYNIGRDDDVRPLRDVASLACELAGASPELIEDVDPPPMQTVVKRLSMERIRSLGWRPRVELEEGMTRTYQWVKAWAVGRSNGDWPTDLYGGPALNG